MSDHKLKLNINYKPAPTYGGYSGTYLYTKSTNNEKLNNERLNNDKVNNSPVNKSRFVSRIIVNNSNDEIDQENENQYNNDNNNNNDDEYDNDEYDNDYNEEDNNSDEILSYNYELDNLPESKHHTDKTSNPSIIKDLEKLELPDIIKIGSYNVYCKLKVTTTRGKRRKKLIFCCAFYAYKERKIPFDPKELAKKVGIGINEISKALSQFTRNFNYTMINYRYTAIDFINYYQPFTGLADENLSDIIRLANEILEKDRKLNDQFPQMVAAAIISYYMMINGIQKNGDFMKKIGKTEIALNPLIDSIGIAHNS
jgi:hypothetical protein